MPFSLAARELTGSSITANLVATALASSPGEIKSLLLSLSIYWILIFFFWNALCLAFFYFLWSRKNWQWENSVRIKCIILSVLMLLIPYIFLGKSSEFSLGNNIHGGLVDKFIEEDRWNGFESDLITAFPYELPLSIAHYFKAKAVVNWAREKKGIVEPEIKLRMQENAPEVIVLVIGESSSRNAWHLFHKEAPETTPRLSKRAQFDDGLLIFGNVVAQATATRQAVPSILTNQPLIWPDGKANIHATPSIVSMAGKAGYETAWFSNQAAIGQYDGIIAAYAEEANKRAFLNPSSFTRQGTYDNVLLNPMTIALNEGEKSFIVLHTLGSHFQFLHRYPSGFGPFPMSEEITQTYANSIAYTDQFVESVIAELEEKGRRAVMIYVSDHGQALPSKSCGTTDINRFGAEAYEIPVIIWLSQQYREVNGDAFHALKKISMAFTQVPPYSELS